MPTTKAQLDSARAQEAEAVADAYISVPLSDPDGVTKDVRVLPANKWRASALRALRAGDVDGFMAYVLHEGDYDTYVDLDPDQDGFQQFAEDAAKAGGEELGKSGGRSRSGSSTRKS